MSEELGVFWPGVVDDVVGEAVGDVVGEAVGDVVGEAVGDPVGDPVGDGLSVVCTGTADGTSDVFWSCGVVGVQPLARDKAIATIPVENILKLDIINALLR
ncbi:hypothetical protein [Nostoc sp.]|uniref:hypothetical protein n=1 Tax=Nostoc sp. TaxID=1180 RepID=UPI002FF48ACC